MNIEEIRNNMNEVVDKELLTINSIDQSKGLSNPLAKIRRNMKLEIILQLAIVVLFMTYPLFFEMYELPRALYFIFMFITCLMTTAYTLKLGSFLKRNGGYSLNTKDALSSFIFEAKLTLEVYKSFVIAGSLILPIPLFITIYGSVNQGNIELFNKWINLNVSTKELCLLVIGYLIAASLIYLITIGYTKKLYGIHLEKLEKTLKEIAI